MTLSTLGCQKAFEIAGTRAYSMALAVRQGPTPQGTHIRTLWDQFRVANQPHGACFYTTGGKRHTWRKPTSKSRTQKMPHKPMRGLNPGPSHFKVTALTTVHSYLLILLPIDGVFLTIAWKHLLISVLKRCTTFTTVVRCVQKSDEYEESESIVNLVHVRVTSSVC